MYTLLRRQNCYKLKLQKCISHFDEQAVTFASKKKKLTDLKPVDHMNENNLKKYYLLRQIEDFEKCFLRLRTHVLHHLFTLPNDLHVDTPSEDDDDDYIIQSNISVQTVGQNHIELGHRLGVLKYSNPACYYLLDEAANLEIALQNYVCDFLSEELNFKPFRNPDTSHDFITKGIYVDDLEREGFTLGDIHQLVGGASFAAFCAYKANTSTHQKFMPEKYFSCGGRYIPPSDDTDKGLYSVVQRSNIQAYLASSTEEGIQLEYEKMLEWLISFYKRLGLNFRVCNKRASSLHLGESLRTCIQLYSADRKEFVDASYISYCGDFVSQRIRILNHDKHENSFTTWILDITVLSVPVVLANFLERSTDKLFVPECVLPYMFKTPYSITPRSNK